MTIMCIMFYCDHPMPYDITHGDFIPLITSKTYLLHTTIGEHSGMKLVCARIISRIKKENKIDVHRILLVSR